MMDIFAPDQVALARSRCRAERSLTFCGLGIRLLADDETILAYLEDYFDGLAEDDNARPELRIYLVSQQPDTRGADWTPVKRAKASPLGLKEAYVDGPEGRWIHKVRTGMVMFQSLSDPMVVGDLHRHRAQVVNFINNQFLNHHQRQGYLLGHAAAFSIHGHTTAIAASSGGGKSTLMLRALETPQARFLSNDRILFQPADGRVNVLGVAKHPRVNPGTLLHSERLNHILPATERSRFEGIPTRDLWAVEQKYDVRIPAVYGQHKTALAGGLDNLILLDWSLDSASPTALEPVDITANPDALEGLRKSPGPFFQQADGRFPPEQAAPSQTYAEHLPGVRVWRLTGHIDFDRAIELLDRQGVLQ